MIPPALQQRASLMFFRSSPAWERQRALPCLGWRLRKCFLEVKSQGYAAQEVHGSQILVWVSCQLCQQIYHHYRLNRQITATLREVFPGTHYVSPCSSHLVCDHLPQTQVGETPYLDAAILSSALKYLAGISHPFVAKGEWSFYNTSE